MGEPLQGILITSREIYDAVVRLTGRVDVLIEQQTHTRQDVDDLKKELRDTARDFEDRLRTLEKGKWPLASLGAVLALASLGLAIFTALNN